MEDYLILDKPASAAVDIGAAWLAASTKVREAEEKVAAAKADLAAAMVEEAKAKLAWSAAASGQSV